MFHLEVRDSTVSDTRYKEGRKDTACFIVAFVSPLKAFDREREPEA